MVFSSEPYKTGILLTKSSPGIYDLESLLTLLDVIFGVTSALSTICKGRGWIKGKIDSIVFLIKILILTSAI